jgi:CheY-like chemotaxis protein
MAISSADRSAKIVAAEDPAELNQLINTGAALVLLNRVLGYDFDGLGGVDVITQLRQTHPHVKTMLVSNYAEAQSAAVAAGALPGFGKRELGSPRVPQLLRTALGLESAPSAKAS